MNDISVEPMIATQDDINISMRIPLDRMPLEELIEKAAFGVVELRISFSVEKCRFFGLFCKNSRTFSQVGFVLPNQNWHSKRSLVRTRD